MPSRTPEAAALIASLPEKMPDKLCNARTPTGYCHMPAGFKTDHPGKDRCYLHGGRAGRPISHGLYSNKLNSDLLTEYKNLVNDPMLIDLYGEFAFAKTMMGNFIESIQAKLISFEGDIWTTANDKGVMIVSPEAKILISMLETISRLFVRIVDAESKSKNTLTMKQVYDIVMQIKNAMNDTCGECPIRIALSGKLTNVKVPKME